MYCQKCGNKLKENQNYCNKCGTKIEVNPKESNNTIKQKISTQKVIIISAAFIFIVFLVGIISYFNFSNVSTDSSTLNAQVKTLNQEPKTAAETLYLIDEYQAKYFRIIRKHDALLQLDLNADCDRDMEELNLLFKDVRSKIKNSYYLSKYDEIEKHFAENSGETNADMCDFAQRNYNAVDGLLNEVYKVVKTEISHDDFKNLVSSEVKWLKDVESYRAVYESQGFGSIGPLVYLDYQINMRNFRTLLLMLYLK